MPSAAALTVDSVVSSQTLWFVQIEIEALHIDINDPIRHRLGKSMRLFGWTYDAILTQLFDVMTPGWELRVLTRELYDR